MTGRHDARQLPRLPIRPAQNLVWTPQLDPRNMRCFRGSAAATASEGG